MREIKFRAWYEPTKEWLEDTDFNVRPNGVPFDIDAEGDTTYLSYTTLLQYTGLKDKNGTEIYEGDIVRKPKDLHIGGEVVAHESEFQNDAFIEWVDGSFRLNKLGDKSKLYYGVLNFSENTQPELLEVIGNIYENKDLLA